IPPACNKRGGPRARALRPERGVDASVDLCGSSSGERGISYSSGVAGVERTKAAGSQRLGKHESAESVGIAKKMLDLAKRKVVKLSDKFSERPFGEKREN